MQQGQGSGGGASQSQSQCVGENPAMTTEQQMVEAASPISSRPPAVTATGNLDEFMRLSADEAAGDEGDRGGGGAGGASGNRWPRQETLALLEIRSDMDADFRDATVKGPLWEDVSRKLAELGYKRNAKKCKEKFENVHKYYKRTKEARGGRQDGKSYKFFTQLEALHSSSNLSASSAMPLTSVTTTTGLDVAPVSVGIPISSSANVRIPPSNSQQPLSTLGLMSSSSSMFPPDHHFTATTCPGPHPGGSAPTVLAQPAAMATTATPFGVSFSSNSSSSSPGSDDDNEEEFEEAGEPSNTAGSSRKRKRYDGSSSSSTRRMMDFFEGLMKQVMQKQETMQQRFLEAIEKREQDRMIREEAWKRQEMARLAREHELMAQERAISASRDAAILSFLQRITGQTIQLPAAIVTSIPAASPPPPPPPQQQPVPAAAPAPASVPHPPPPSLPQQQHTRQQQAAHHHQHLQNTELAVRYEVPSINSSQVVMAIPEQQVPPPLEIGASGSSEPSSSRWPKTEVLALINLRSGLESRYQEAGPKGPLWEEISAGMQRMGYKRNAKRCKEKWENINKYFKKVKESNKKRPEDAKTCPYFHQLDALYQRKILSSSSGGSSSFSNQNRPQEQPPPSQYQQEMSTKSDDPTPASKPQNRTNVAPAPQLLPASESENKNTSYNADVQASNEGLPGSLFGEGNEGAGKKPEDIVREMMEQQGTQQQQQHQQQRQPLMVDDYDKIEEPDSDNHDEDEDEDADDEELEEEGKMAYKIEFQRQNKSASNGGGNGAPSFLAMVQ